EFTNILKKGDFPSEKIRPYYESFREPILGWLNEMGEKVVWQEWEVTPEIHNVENKIHFITPLTIGEEKATLCFSFEIENAQWYFQHLEAITIRLDKLTSLPVSKFPDLTEQKKAKMREEKRVADQVRLFNFLSKEKGEQFAFNWFKDGNGYALAARAWVPFFPLSKAFILFFCWEMSNLNGNEVTLEKLTDEEALVRMKPLYFIHYHEAAHLKQKISFQNYQKIFETIWQDRAEKARWALDIKYAGDECLFYFKNN
ncbi:hypothetical protein B6I21_01400, partial [candidate division KSB1 bacterium 4572_119]